MHVHVSCGDGEAKFWVEPEVSLARNYGLKGPQLREVKSVVEARRDEIVEAWREHFGR